MTVVRLQNQSALLTISGTQTNGLDEPITGGSEEGNAEDEGA